MVFSKWCLVVVKTRPQLYVRPGSKDVSATFQKTRRVRHSLFDVRPRPFPVLDLSSSWAVLFLGGSEILIGIVIFNLKQIGLTILEVFHGVLF